MSLAHLCACLQACKHLVFYTRLDGWGAQVIDGSNGGPEALNPSGAPYRNTPINPNDQPDSWSGPPGQRLCRQHQFQSPDRRWKPVPCRSSKQQTKAATLIHQRWQSSCDFTTSSTCAETLCCCLSLTHPSLKKR